MTALWSQYRNEHCASCGEERVFEQPPCLDGALECEWSCVVCGHALLIAFDIDPDDVDIEHGKPVRAVA